MTVYGVPVTSDGLVDAGWWRQRQDAYLAIATEVFAPAAPLSVIEHLERHRRDPTHGVDVEAIGDAELEAWFCRIDGWLDCGDFDILRLLHLWFGYRDLLPERVVDALAERFLGFGYWYTDPVPDGVVDQRWYWSENHRLIFHAIEHLAGQAFPEATFTNDGRTGAELVERGRRWLHEWFDDKARWGFSEWHSDVYYSKDIAPLLTLVEWAEDPGIAERAAAFLDLLLFDVALHTHRGNMGVTHGRSYMKDKSRAVDQPVFAGAKLCFDTTSAPWSPPEVGAARLLPRNETATLLSRSARYRPPEAIRRVATRSAPMLDREHMSVPIDPDEPLSDEPVRADGLSYSDPAMVPFWWDRSALTPWQLVELTMDTLDRYELWDADLFAPARGLRDVTGGDRSVARQLARDLAPMAAGPLLAAVDTMTYRTAHAMFSSAVSYRPGNAGYQHHIWQATLDEDAVVFTTHPGNEPWPDVAESVDADRYWTGTATLPRSVQHGAAAIHQYAPAFASPEMPELAMFAYLPFTHAFFPVERFDEVRSVEGWTLGRRGDGYVALWSWRSVRWRHHDPAEVHTHGLRERFDLVADGGAANVWIAEVGDVDRWGSFDAFCDAVAAASIGVEDLGSDEAGAHRGFDVRYVSPTEGELAVGWTGPLHVDGVEVPVGGHPRFDNPFAQVSFGDPVVTIREGDAWVELDLAAGTRRAGLG